MCMCTTATCAHEEPATSTISTCSCVGASCYLCRSASSPSIALRGMDDGALCGFYGHSGVLVLHLFRTNMDNQRTISTDHTGYEPPVPMATSVAINQKLDRIMALVGEQKETALIKADVEELRTELESCRSSASVVSSSQSSKPSSTAAKLPLELSVSFKVTVMNILYHCTVTS